VAQPSHAAPETSKIAAEESRRQSRPSRAVDDVLRSLQALLVSML
jgi:hypothetical protein